ncbi:hypothetical protein [Nocardioides eburneiflavus]|uniref:hypothetical protein n=1 Tax=Nocardioides eburneiflavus TaxID=2518372 RepID=UPI003CCC4C7E
MGIYRCVPAANPRFIVLTGMAGLVAGAFSMAMGERMRDKASLTAFRRGRRNTRLATNQPLASPATGCMRTTFDRNTGLGFVSAFGGHGVTAANISGRTMRDLILNDSTDLTSLPWVRHHPQLGTRAHPIHHLQAHHQDPRRLRCLRVTHREGGQARTAGPALPATGLADPSRPHGERGPRLSAGPLCVSCDRPRAVSSRSPRWRARPSTSHRRPAHRTAVDGWRSTRAGCTRPADPALIPADHKPRGAPRLSAGPLCVSCD